MYDALMVAGYIKQSELAPHWRSLLVALGERAINRGGAWFALERLDDDPLEIIASRLEVLGPVTEHALDMPEANIALQALETQGRILRGRFTPGVADLEWCDRRLLARIHRYTLTGCGRRSSRSAPPTSCAFSSTGSTWRGKISCAASKASLPRWSNSRASSWRRPAGNTTYCPRASTTTAASSSTSFAFPVAWRGDGSHREAGRLCAARRLRCCCASTPMSGSR